MTPPTYRVLVIDDDEEEYLVVARYLRKATAALYTVTWISSYEQALVDTIICEHDICLLDYHLGEHTGIGLLRALRAAGYRAPMASVEEAVPRYVERLMAEGAAPAVT